MSQILATTDPSGPTVGRERELEIVTSLVDHARAGSGGALIVRGEPGIGKTVLLAEAQRGATAAGLRVLSCSGVPAESNLPFAGLHQMLWPVLTAIGEVSARQAHVLRATFESAGDLAPEIYRVALATLELLTAAAADTPLLLVADDAHWLDRPSADVLGFVGRRIGAEPIALIVALREGTDDPFAGRDLPQLALRPLSDSASASLLEQVAPGLANDFRERVLNSAAGNPLALTELPLHTHRWGPSTERMAVGDLIEGVYTARVADLPRATRALLLAAVADPGGSFSELCGAASEVEGRPVDPSDLQPAIDAGLVKADGRHVTFRHPLLVSAIYQSADVGARLGTHRALAGAVLDDDRRTWHRAAASLGSDDEVASALEALSERALRRGAISVSITALERMAALTSDRTRRADGLLRASERAAEIGRRGLATNLVAQANYDDLSALGKARMMIVQEGLWPRRPDTAATVTDLVDASRSAHTAGDASLAAAVLWTAARRCYWTSAALEDRLAVAGAETELGMADDDPRHLAICSYAGVTTRRGALERRLGLPSVRPGDAPTLAHLGSAALNLEDHARAVTLLAAAATEARKQGRLGAIPRLQSLQAWSSLWSGPLDAVTAAAGEAERLAVELDQPMWHGAALLAHAFATAFRGDYLAGREQVQTALRSDGLRDVRLFHAMGLLGLGVAALGSGEFHQAYQDLRRVVDADDPESHYAATQWVAGYLVEAARRTGQLDDCGALLDSLREGWATDPSATVQRGLRYEQALLAPDASADERYRAALAHPHLPGLDVGRINLAYGEWLRRQRRVREARAVLEEAKDAFERLGMGGFADRAGHELRAAGGVDTRRHGGGVSQLTPQELQIAQMAANGLSNRQIAEQLFLSHRTVSSHLYHVYPKLGIAGRGELAEALATGRR